jgi:hypothetical protein
MTSAEWMVLWACLTSDLGRRIGEKLNPRPGVLVDPDDAEEVGKLMVRQVRARERFWEAVRRP